MRIAKASRALMQANACGDQSEFWDLNPGWLLCMVDGIGHGELAEAAALAAIDYVAAHQLTPFDSLFADCDRVLRPTRGVAMSLIRIDDTGAFEYAGIGNTQGRLYRADGSKPLRLLGDYGIVGGGYRKLRPQSDSLLPGDLLILFTDGIDDKFDLLGYGPDLLAELPKLAVLMLQDWGRSHDDAALLLYRHQAGTEGLI